VGRLSPNWRRALAKYSKRYPEAVRSLAEEEEKTFTFYDFPERMHRHIQTTNAIESLWSLVRQRTDQIDVFTRRVQLPDDCMGHYRGISACTRISV
jgi:transposase-like protein